ncbi:hypothetical protein, partial [Escherichia coli]|uniref:hypothetical protein n=1 Tax=Escherichia coli TaxID=562 RepID=UPI003FA433B1
SLRQKQKKLIMLPSETMIWQPEFTDKTLSRKTGAVHKAFRTLCCFAFSVEMEGYTVRANNLSTASPSAR